MDISTVILRGTRAAQPTPVAAPNANWNNGWIYAVTDEGVIERSSGSAWETFGAVRKDVTAADATFTDTFTVTVPNVANAARFSIEILAALGAGGSIGAFEGAAAARLEFVVTRTVGLATAIGTMTLTNNAAGANVVGGATATIAVQASALTGANSATQTFTVQVKVTRGSGTSTSHKVSAHARLLGSAAGITIT